MSIIQIKYFWESILSFSETNSPQFHWPSRIVHCYHIRTSSKHYIMFFCWVEYSCKCCFHLELELFLYLSSWPEVVCIVFWPVANIDTVNSTSIGQDIWHYCRTRSNNSAICFWSDRTIPSWQNEIGLYIIYIIRACYWILQEAGIRISHANSRSSKLEICFSPRFC